MSWGHCFSQLDLACGWFWQKPVKVKRSDREGEFCGNSVLFRIIWLWEVGAGGLGGGWVGLLVSGGSLDSADKGLKG